MDWAPLLGFPIEWAALSLFVVGCLYWERAGLTGLGIEGSVLAATLGILLGYEGSGDYGTAALLGVGAGVAFALAAGGLILASRSDPAVGAFCLSLLPACALGLLLRGTSPRLIQESPPPGLVGGSVFEGTYAEDFLASPWFLAAPVALAVAGLVILRTPYGLRLRAFGETPALGAAGRMPVAWYRLSGAALGALWAVPGAALLLRRHPEDPPFGLGYVALACAIAGRWSIAAGVLLAAGPALLRAARPYASGAGSWGIALEMAPYGLALLYLVTLSRRALRASSSPQSRLDPDVL